MAAEIRKLKFQKKEMTMNYNKEIQANKTQQIAQLRNQNQKILNEEYMCKIIFFDAMSGLDEDIRKMLNERLEEVTEDCNQKVAQLVSENERHVKEVQALRKLAPEMYSLAQYEAHEIIRNLPIVCEDIDLIWELLHEAYGEDCFTPCILKKFPNAQGDAKGQKE